MFNTDHIHPMLVHFPIALITIGFMAELIYIFFKKERCLSRTGLYLMFFGTIGAIAAYLAGDFFTNEMTGEPGKVRETHELFASITMYTMIVASILRIWLIYKKQEESRLKWLVFCLYAIGTVAVGITGFYGGSLVFNYMIGI